MRNGVSGGQPAIRGRPGVPAGSEGCRVGQGFGPGSGAGLAVGVPAFSGSVQSGWSAGLLLAAGG